MPSDLLKPLLIGLMVMAAIYISLQWIIRGNPQSKRALGVFGGACGLLTTFWLLENPEILADYAAQIVTAGVAVVLSLLWLARRSIR